MKENLYLLIIQGLLRRPRLFLHVPRVWDQTHFTFLAQMSIHPECHMGSRHLVGNQKRSKAFICMWQGWNPGARMVKRLQSPAVSSSPSIPLSFPSIHPLRRVWLFMTPGLLPTRLLCPSDFPGKNTGVGRHFLLQGIFSTQGSLPSPVLAGRFFTPAPPGKPFFPSTKEYLLNA